MHNENDCCSFNLTRASLCETWTVSMKYEQVLLLSYCVNTQRDKDPTLKSCRPYVSHTTYFQGNRVYKNKAEQSLTNGRIMIQTEGLFIIWYLFSVQYLEEPLWFWKGPVSSDSISSGCQFPDNHILLTQEPHQPLAVAGHPAVAVCGPLAPIKLDGVLGHLVLLQHSKCPRRAKAQQPTYNLHPNLYFCLHPSVKIDEEKKIWEMEKRKAWLLQRSTTKNNKEENTICIYSKRVLRICLVIFCFSYCQQIPRKDQTNNELLSLTSTICVWKAWYSLFLCDRELHCCPKNY